MVRKSIIVMLGPAGSGKTSLVASLGKWIEKKQLVPVLYVNLDPGAPYTPYAAEVNIREYVKVEDVMAREKLGPNGALIRSIELAREYLPEIVERIGRSPKPYVLVDTPGQMELFLFRDLGVEFVEAMRRVGYIIGVLIFDHLLAARPQDVVSLRLLATIVQLRLGVDVIPVINKSDVSSETRERLSRALSDSSSLLEELKSERGLLGEMSEKVVGVLDEYRFATRVPLVSALTWEGLEELYDMLHEIFCACGDLT
ncbi:ATP/GTP-binding protein [Thermofilum pendens]|uniref:PRK13768 family protein n=1 Tax=Thermofilum pendens TaxID=2269 RepID=UPI000699D1F5|nr:ATP/GTP-binding protein [Thermofilum pendens]